MKISLMVRSKEIERGYYGIYVDRILLTNVSADQRKEVSEIAVEKNLTVFEIGIAGGVTTLYGALSVVKQMQKKLLVSDCPLELSYIRIGATLPLTKRKYSPILWNEILGYCRKQDIDLVENYQERSPIIAYTPLYGNQSVVYN